jgi:hypothetical protein
LEDQPALSPCSFIAERESLLPLVQTPSPYDWLPPM